ncbi:hypothetical protein [Flavobacterium sp. XGLA_31]|uniref:hypothetical protein n=1 Tax=Flavobacterium sp. XGLA_31 TaxID=3447666 RepID=UPI003F31E81B
MTEKVITRFKELFDQRCNLYPLLNFGEDSVRYDFFSALTEIMKFQPWQVQLEYAMNKDAYNLRGNLKSKRKEKPMLDLIVNEKGINFCIEFALFRQNSNDESGINVTERTIKMINDMLRLALEAHYSNREAYFICVADDKMLGHRLRSKALGRFPSSYEIDNSTIEEISKLTSGELDSRFTSKFLTHKSKIKSKLIFNEKVVGKKIKIETRILIWKVKMK